MYQGFFAGIEGAKLNLAAGNKVIEGWTNHDRWRHRDEIDTTWDLEMTPWEPWEDGQFNAILAHDIIEHVHRPILFIEELWRISAPNARVYVHTAWAGPQPGAREVWRDPTHVRPFHEASFAYFDPIKGGFWFSEYGKFYSPARFEVLSINPEPPDNIAFFLRAIKE